MKKKIVFGIIGAVVLAGALVWAVNHYDAVQREHRFEQNERLLARIDSLNIRTTEVQDSLKRFNPDPLLTVYESIQRSDELISHISYTKKILGEGAYIDLMESPDLMLLSEPQVPNVAKVFEGSDREKYTKEDLLERLDRFVFFHENYTGLNVDQLKSHVRALDETEGCNNSGYDCYAFLIEEMNALIFTIEEMKIKLLKR